MPISYLSSRLSTEKPMVWSRDCLCDGMSLVTIPRNSAVVFIDLNANLKSGMWLYSRLLVFFFAKCLLVEADLVDIYSTVQAYASSVLMEERSGVLHLPQWAVEGTSSRYWSDCFISQHEMQPWWMIDLKAQRLIRDIRVTTMRGSSNLPNVRLNGMNGLLVVVTNTSLSNGTDGVMCGHPWTYPHRDIATIRFRCRGVLGRYVFIKLNVASPQYLALCEVVLNREKGKHLMVNFNDMRALVSAFPRGDGRAALVIDGVNSMKESFCTRTGSTPDEKSRFQLFLKRPHLVTKVNVLLSNSNTDGVEVSVGSGLTRLSDYHKCVAASRRNGWRVFVCPEPWLAHYVVISSMSSGRLLYLCEVQVFYDPILDIYSPASISASSQQHLINPVWKALDGSERVNSGECYQSVYGAGAFWELTLSEVTPIHVVDVVYKSSSDMDGMVVYVGNRTDKIADSMIQCASVSKARQNDNARFHCVSPIKGQSVYITTSNTTKSRLTLCEVKVYRPDFPPEFIIRPSNITLRYNEVGSLICSAVGRPFPVIKWRWVGGQYINYSKVYRNGSAIVSEVQIRGLSGGGLVECFIEKGVNNSISSVAAVEVASYITVKPQNHTILNFDRRKDVSLFCEAVGYPHPVVVWVKPSGTVHSSLTVTEKPNTAMSALVVRGAREAGIYTCMAFNAIGGDAARATVFAQAQIVTSSVECQRLFTSKLVGPLHCAAVGYPLPRLYWRKDGVAVDSVRYKVSGVNNTIARNLTLGVVSVSDIGMYTCTASNGIGDAAVTTSVVLVDVRRPFPIQPKNAVATMGDYVNMMCLVTDFTFNYDSLTWWKGSVQLPESSWTTRKICGGIHSILTIKNVTESEGSSDYYCIAGTTSLPNQFESRHAVLSVRPYFAKTPKDATIVSGKRLILTCKACGYPIPTVIWSWRLGGIDHILFPTKTIHSPNDTGVVTSQLMYSSRTAQPGVYRCIAEGRLPDGRLLSVESDAAVIRMPAHVVTGYKTVKVNWGRSVSLRCKAAGYPVPTITWYSPNDSRFVRTDRVGSTWSESILQITSFDGWLDGGEYHCRASNSTGFHHTAIATLQFVEHVVGQSQSQLVPYGSAFSLTCIVVSFGSSNVSISWFRNGRLLNSTSSIDETSRGMIFKRTSRLIVSAASLSDAGNYSCLDPLNDMTIVNVGPLFLEVPMNRSVMAGETVNLQCRVLAVLGSELKWEGETALGDSVQVVTTAGRETKALLVFHNIDVSKTGRYRCLALVRDPRTGRLMRFPSSVAHVAVVGANLARWRVPQVVTVLLLDRRSVLVTWTKPDNVFEPVQQYTVHYEGKKWYNFDNERHFVDMNETLIVDPSVLETRIDHLLSDVRFAFTVSTFTQTDEQSSHPVYIKTLIDVPEVPLLPPQNFSNQHQLIALSQPSNLNGPIKCVQILVSALSGEDASNLKFNMAVSARYVDSLSRNLVYIAAQFEYGAIPSSITIGDGRVYGGYYNGPIVPNTRYAYALRAYSSDNRAVLYSTSLPLEFTSETVGSLTADWLLSVVVVSAVCIAFFFIVVFFACLITWMTRDDDKRVVAMDQEDKDVQLVGGHLPVRSSVTDDVEFEGSIEEFDTRPRVLAGVDGFRRSYVESCFTDEDFDDLDENDSAINDDTLKTDTGSPTLDA